jgi:hypothetical protein
MVNIPTDPVFGNVTRAETSTVALGGDIVNSPNLQFKQLADRDQYLFNLVTGAPVVVAPIATQQSIESGDQIIIDLDTVFTGTNTPLTYSIALNSDPTKVTTNINANNLEIDFPIWTNNFVDVATVTITVRATDTLASTADNSFVVQVTSLDSLFTEDYFAFDYSSTLAGADIYVNAAERDNILADPDLNAVFTLANGGQAVFKGILASNPTIPASAISAGEIEGCYRFRYVGADPGFGSYLYTGEAEAVTIRGNADFVEESGGAGNPAFWFYSMSSTRADSFKRYRYTTRRANGDYIYALGTAVPGVPATEYTFEGTIGKVKVIN